MDGSRRSAHANAYFTGFGTSKRVVFFDTLLAQLNPAEVDAVLAHELGHFQAPPCAQTHADRVRCQPDRPGGTGLAQPASLVLHGAGRRAQPAGPNDALALLLFMMVLPLASTFVGPGLRTHRAATNSRPTRMPWPKPRPPTWPVRCSSSMRTTPQP